MLEFAQNYPSMFFMACCLFWCAVFYTLYLTALNNSSMNEYKEQYSILSLLCVVCFFIGLLIKTIDSSLHNLDVYYEDAIKKHEHKKANERIKNHE